MTVITGESVKEARRYEVVRQIVRGKTMTTIANELGVDVSTVYKDFQYVRLNAMDYIDKFASDIIPIEIMKCLTRVNMVSDAAWKIFEESKDERVKLMALDKAEKSAINIVHLITNNKDLIDIVYEMRGGRGGGKDEKAELTAVSAKDVSRQRRLPGSVVKEFQDAVKRQEDAYESEYKDQSEDDATTTTTDAFAHVRKPQYVEEEVEGKATLEQDEEEEKEEEQEDGKLLET
jgi:hypothetical protein